MARRSYGVSRSGPLHNSRWGRAADGSSPRQGRPHERRAICQEDFLDALRRYEKGELATHVPTGAELYA